MAEGRRRGLRLRRRHLRHFDPQYQGRNLRGARDQRRHASGRRRYRSRAGRSGCSPICPTRIELDRHVWNSARLAAEDAKKQLSDHDEAETEVVVELPDRRVAQSLDPRRARATWPTPFVDAHARAMPDSRSPTPKLDARRDRRGGAGRRIDADAAGAPARRGVVSAASRSARSIRIRWWRSGPPCRRAC